MPMKLITVGFSLVFIGVLIIIVGVFSMAYEARKIGGVETPEGGLRGGGVIMIGPIPIIFGTDVSALKIVMILAIVLMVIAVLLIILHVRIV